MRRRSGRSVLLWIILVVLVILLLGLLFGGYRKGSKVGAGPDSVVRPVATSVVAT